MSTVDLQEVDDLFSDVADGRISSAEFERRISKMTEDAGIQSYEEGWQDGHSVGYEEGMNERDYDGD